MKRDEALRTLKGVETDLRAKGVVHAAIFGSVARGDDGPHSDIDIMLEFDPAARVGVWGYVGVVREIQNLFPHRVDVSDKAGLKPDIQRNAERDAVYAF